MGCVYGAFLKYQQVADLLTTRKVNQVEIAKSDIVKLTIVLIMYDNQILNVKSEEEN